MDSDRRYDAVPLDGAICRVVSAPEDISESNINDLAPRLGVRSWRRILALGASLAVAVSFFAVALGNAQEKGAIADIPDLVELENPFKLYSIWEDALDMPNKSNAYDGILDARPVTVVDDEWGQAHVFAIGDWGAPLPDQITASSDVGIDDHAQFAVANAMKGRASWAKPAYVLNVGDNFYLGGIAMDCNAAPGEAWDKPKADFTTTWTNVYESLTEIPWLSVLGNHDYGGWMFNQGWPQQIGYSFINYNWVMPARYFNKIIQHPTFDVEYFMLDTNAYDAKAQGDEPEHNICSVQHNLPGAHCTGNDGMQNVWACRDWFWGSWDAQKRWFEEKLAMSTARWKIVVTHFPCGYDGSWFQGLKQAYGLDLLVTGHRHQQELWWPGTTSKYVQNFMWKNHLGDIPCFVTGGGGGITAQKFVDADYGRDLLWYGFFDLTIAKDWLKIELIGLDGAVAGNYTIHPRLSPEKIPTPY